MTWPRGARAKPARRVGSAGTLLATALLLAACAGALQASAVPPLASGDAGSGSTASALPGLAGPASGATNVPASAEPAVPAAPNGAITANPDAQLFVEPEDGTAPVLRELNAAAHSVDMAMYLLTDKPAISALEADERRGVQVRVLLEQHPYGYAAGNNAVFAQLQRAGVAVRWADPAYKLTHEKAIGIDRHETLILTLNLTASAFSRNREYGVVDHAPGDVAEMEGLFEADWNRTTYQPLQPDLVVSPVNSRERLLHLIGAAGRELDVESEEVQDRALEDALTAAAHRGVRVRLVISPASSGADANAPGVARLKAGSVQVRELSRPYIHAKIFLADGAVAFVGSENISTASLDDNRELGVFVDNPAALQRMASTFQQDWDARG